jgi:AcrR family transcriptional regulator
LAKNKLISDDLRYLIFGEIYQRYSEPKARRKALTLLEAAITCFDKAGLEHVTFKTLAREAGLTAPSLRHYFANLEEIRELALKYIHLTSQKIVVDAMSAATDPDEMFRCYLEAHYKWAKNFKSHIRVWLSFLSYCSRNKDGQNLNTSAMANGARRIDQLIEIGKDAGVFTAGDGQDRARMIQALLLGWLTTLITEKLPNPDQYTQQVFKQCFVMLRA